MFRKDILLAVKGKQIHRQLKHLPTKPATLALFLTSRPGLTFWQILGIGTACRSKGCHPTKEGSKKEIGTKLLDQYLFCSY